MFMLLGFILFVLPYNPKDDAMAYIGVTWSLFFPTVGFFRFTCLVMACSKNYCNSGVFSHELIKCVMGLADQCAHASKCYFVHLVV